MQEESDIRPLYIIYTAVYISTQNGVETQVRQGASEFTKAVTGSAQSPPHNSETQLSNFVLQGPHVINGQVDRLLTITKQAISTSSSLYSKCKVSNVSA